MNESPHMLRQMRRMATVLEQVQTATSPIVLPVPPTPSPRGDIFVCPGSFNPPTFAHLALLKQALTGLQAHAIHLYCAFSAHTINKENVERPLLLDRMFLLQQVLKRHIPRVGILLFNRGLYLEQAQAIRLSFPHVHRICFLMGFDKIVQIFDPHYYEDRNRALDALFAQAELYVAPREQASVQELQQLLQLPENQPYARYVHSLPLDPAYRMISSTRARAGTANMDEVPHEVRVFIARYRPYAPPVRCPDGSLQDVYALHVQRLQDFLAAGTTRSDLR